MKCPKCGNVFTVDESEYAALLSQVKNAEFESELARRVHELEQSHKAQQQADQARQAAEQQAAQLRRDQQFAQQMQALQTQIQSLQAQIAQAEQQKQLAVMELRQKALTEYAKKEQELATLRSQMDDPIHLLLPHQSQHPLEVTDIHLDEPIVGSPLHIPQIRQIPRIRQLIQVNDPVLRILLHKKPHHMAPNEPGSAGYNDGSHIIIKCSYLFFAIHFRPLRHSG